MNKPIVMDFETWIRNNIDLKEKYCNGCMNDPSKECCMHCIKCKRSMFENNLYQIYESKKQKDLNRWREYEKNG